MLRSELIELVKGTIENYNLEDCPGVYQKAYEILKKRGIKPLVLAHCEDVEVEYVGNQIARFDFSCTSDFVISRIKDIMRKGVDNRISLYNAVSGDKEFMEILRENK